MRLGDFVNLNPKIKLTKGIPYAFVEMKDLEPSTRSVFSNYDKKFSGSGSKFECGDTLLARITPCLENGKTSQFKGHSSPAWGSTEFIVLRSIPDKSDNDFIYYLSRSPEFRSYAIQNMVGSSGRQRVPNDAVENYECEFPSLHEQKAIAHILGTLDDKIELNQELNQTLEETAKAIFKSWFVDFDPVRAKAEGRPTGLPTEISDLFPSELVDTEIGEIPKGWEVKTIQDVAKVTSGKRPPEKESVQNERCPYVVFGGAGPMAFCSEPLDFTKPAIITGRVGTLGKVFYLTDECWVSDNAILICDAGTYTPLIFYILQSIDFTTLNVGSTQPLVTGKDIKNLNLITPSDSLLQYYKALFDLIKFRQSTADAEIEVLSQLRDILLPKLISGELRIPDAEKFLEEAGI